MVLASFDGAAGTENMSSLLISALAKHYAVSLWSINRKGHFFRQIEPQMAGLHAFSSGRFAGIRNALRLAVAMLRCQPAAVMVFEYRMGIALGMALSWLPAPWRPFTIFCHHVQLRYRLEHAPAREARRIRRLFPLINVHTVPSQALADELLDCLSGLDASNIRVIANGIDLSRIAELARAPLERDRDDVLYRCVCLGALRPDKHIDEVIRAFSELPLCDDALLWIIGDGPQRESLVELARSLDVGDRCMFLGELTNPHPYLARATLLVHMSERETFGLAALEAMAHGVPVLAMCEQTDGLRTILQDGVQGRLIEGNNRHAFVQAWQALLADADTRRRMGEAGRIQAQRFPAGAMYRGYRQLLGLEG